MPTPASPLHFPLGDQRPPAGGALDVAEGVRWVRMGLPFALDHINLWLLRDELDGRPGWTVVDCCVDRPESRTQWETLFAHALDGLPVLRVVVTHMHPDHVGLAHWLCERWSTPAHDCRLWMSATDHHLARLGTHHTTGFGGDAAADFFASHGLTDPEALAHIRARDGYYPSLVPAVPRAFRRLVDGMALTIGGRTWRCISGHGHAPEHMALHCEALGVLISGDMVLPRISTNVSVYEMEPEADALDLFLASLDKFRLLPAETRVLPSHGLPFVGLHARLDQLHAHHAERLRELAEACATAPRCAHEVLPLLFQRPLDLHQTTFAMGEAVAHLNRLWHAGHLQRARGPDGVYRYAPA